MMAMAVNCLVHEANLKFVRESIAPRVRNSLTPYSRCNRVCPFRLTSTATPGDRLSVTAAKIRSILVSGETIAALRWGAATREIDSNAAPTMHNDLLKMTVFTARQVLGLKFAAGSHPSVAGSAWGYPAT